MLWPFRGHAQILHSNVISGRLTFTKLGLLKIRVQHLGTEQDQEVPSLDAFSNPQALPSPCESPAARDQGVTQEGTQDPFNSWKHSSIKPKSQNVLVINKA